jgi:hypothetical protein
MSSDPSNPFGEFEEDFAKTEKADPASTPGRVPPETYKFVLCAQELKEGDGILKDHRVIVANTGSKGFGLFCEILDPESVPNPKTGEPHITKGVVLEHVFWITQKNLPYVKRDLATILERDDFKMSELTSITWAGRTFEGVVRDETRDGYTRSRIAFINPWVPGKADGKKDADKKGAADTKKDAAKGAATGAAKDTAKPADKKTAASSAKGGNVDF